MQRVLTAKPYVPFAMSSLGSASGMLIRHELMEAFQYRGVQIFDPHRSVDDLALPKRLHEQKEDS